MLSKKNLLFFNSIYGIIIVFVLVVFINIAASYVHLRGDFSRGQIYSVSRATKDVLKSLEQPVLFRLFYSKELPSQVEISKNYVMNLLREYKNAGNVNLEFIPVDREGRSVELAVQSGILPMRFDIYSKDKFEQTEGFFGLEISYLDRRELLPFIDNVPTLEYVLTASIANMTNEKRLSLGFITNADAKNVYSLPSNLVRALESRYDVAPVALLSSSDTTKDYSALMLIAPQRDLNDIELMALDNYLVNGGSVMVLYDTRVNNMESFLSTAKGNKFLMFLANSGIEMQNTFVKDEQSQPIQMEMRQGMVNTTNIIKFPPFVLASNLNKQNPITADLESIIMPFASAITVTGGLDYENLAYSSDRSWYDLSEGEEQNININPFEKMEISTSSVRGPFSLAVALSGKFTPYFATTRMQPVKPGRMVVISTSKIIEESYNMPDVNFIFFLNAVDYLAQNYSLIGIRSKVVGLRPLKELSSSSKTLFRYINIVLPVILAAVLGMGFYLRRRHLNRCYKDLLLKHNE